jgi:predicted GIY-YIG superfamily endonuclease
MPYRVYVLENAAGQFYIGITAEMAVRLAQHNHGVSQWTRGKGPWTLPWTSEAMSLSEARKLENKHLPAAVCRTLRAPYKRERLRER